MHFFILFLLLISSLFSSDRRPSYPYITGDAFRAFADEIFDETKPYLDPKKVKSRSIIFVKTDLLRSFFSICHNDLPPYILITHNADEAIPKNFNHFLDDNKLIAWFGINIENCTHPKLHPIPIGITNRYNSRGGNLKLIGDLRNQLGTFEKKNLLYMNFQTSTYPIERNLVFNYFKDKKYCLTSSEVPYTTFYTDVCESKFVLSPRGNGLDTHRTWEALYLGSIPIVKTSCIDPLFKDLPVLIIDNWVRIDEKLLEKKYREIRARKYNFKKLYTDYWFNLINSYKKYDRSRRPKQRAKRSR